MNTIILIKKLEPNVDLPKKAHPYDAGFDVKAWLPDNQIVNLDNRLQKIPTGLVLQLPPGWVAKLFLRSSVGCSGITLPHAVGIIDAGYRGELMIPVRADWGWSKYIKHGDRLAQVLFERVEDVILEEGELSPADRGVNGFGSTGR